MIRFLLISILLSTISSFTQAQNWTAQASQTNEDLFTVSMANSQTGWAFGAAGTVTKTTNGGAAWVASTVGANYDIMGSFAFNDSTVIAAGQHAIQEGFVIRSTDGGQTWSRDSLTFAQRLNAIHFASGNEGWAVGRDGYLVHSSNGGQSWSAQTSGTTERLFDVFFADANTGWIVGRNGTLRKTTNGGSSWAAQSAGTNNDLSAVFFLNTSKGWLAGEGGQIFITTNGGSTWSAQNTGSTANLFSLAFANDSIGWAGGESGTLLYTTNGGSTWTTQNSATTGDIMDLSILSPGLGWLCATGGDISKLGGGALNAAFSVNNAFCLGETGFFLDASSGPVSSWNWDFGDGSGTSSLQNPTYLYGQPGTYTVQLVVSDGAGQTDTVRQPLTVWPLPQAAFSLSAPAACNGDTLGFTDQSTGAPVGWRWDFGDQSMASVANPRHVYTQGGSYQVSLVVTDANGCRDSLSQSVQINQAMVTVGPASATICAQGDSVVLLASGAVNYVWSPATGLDTTAGSRVVARPAQNTSYQVMGIDANGCRDSAMATISIDASAIPAAGFVPSSTLLCGGKAVQFANTSLQARSYLWSFPGGNPSTSTDPDPVVNYAAPGRYDVQLIALGCAGNDTLLVTELIEVRAEVIAAFTPSADTLNLQVTQTVTFTDQSQNASAWDWDFGNGSSSTQPNPSVTYSLPGIYTVTLIASDGLCADTATRRIVVLNTTGLDPGNSGLKALLYPNPANHEVLLEIEGKPGERYFFTLTDMQGKVLRYFELSPAGVYRLSCDTLSPGIYAYRFSSDAGSMQHGKLMVGKW